MRNYLRYFPIISILFLSCSTSKKISTESKSTKNNDSTAIVSKESTHVKDSAGLKRENNQQAQEVNIEYEPGYADTGDVVINFNGNRITIPTKGLKRVNTRQQSNVQKIDSSKLSEGTRVIEDSKVITHTKETTSDKSSKDTKGSVNIMNLFGIDTTVIYIIAGIILLVIGVLIFIWIRKRKKKNNDSTRVSR